MTDDQPDQLRLHDDDHGPPRLHFEDRYFDDHRIRERARQWRELATRVRAVEGEK